MKKNIVFLIMLSIITFFSCNDNAENLSRVTYFVDLSINGDKEQVITVGSAYSDLGVVATEGDNDVTDQVITSGSVDTSTPGLYTIKYSATNQDGFDSSTERFVIVVPENLSTIDISGVYNGQREGKQMVPEGCEITKISEGVFKATDLFGGYYNLLLGYGSAYALSTYFYLNDDNTYVSVYNTTAWGPWDVLNTTYDPDTNTFKHRVQQGTFGFNVTLTK